MDAILTIGAVYAGVILFLLLSGRVGRTPQRVERQYQSVVGTLVVHIRAPKSDVRPIGVPPYMPPPRLTCLGCDHPLEWCECLAATAAGLTDTEIARAMEGRAA